MKQIFKDCSCFANELLFCLAGFDGDVFHLDQLEKSKPIGPINHYGFIQQLLQVARQYRGIKDYLEKNSTSLYPNFGLE